jgi:hypothetical protein
MRKALTILAALAGPITAGHRAALPGLKTSQTPVTAMGSKRLDDPRMTMLVEYLEARHVLTAHKALLLVCDSSLIPLMTMPFRGSLQSVHRVADSIVVDPSCPGLPVAHVNGVDRPVVAILSVRTGPDTGRLEARVSLSQEDVDAEQAVFVGRSSPHLVRLTAYDFRQGLAAPRSGRE